MAKAKSTRRTTRIALPLSRSKALNVVCFGASLAIAYLAITGDPRIENNRAPALFFWGLTTAVYLFNR